MIDAKEARNKRILDLWLACYTEQEIADAVGTTDHPVRNIVSDFFAELPKSQKTAAEHLTNFEPPLYIWKHRLYAAKKSGIETSRGSWIIEMQHLFLFCY